jgi:hypothetical protein
MTGCNTDCHPEHRKNRKLLTYHTEEKGDFTWFQVNLRKENVFALMMPVIFLENVLTRNSSDDIFSSPVMSGNSFSLAPLFLVFSA